MKKLLLVLLALPLLFSCGGSLEQDLNKEITIEMIIDGYTGKGTSTWAFLKSNQIKFFSLFDSLSLPKKSDQLTHPLSLYLDVGFKGKLTLLLDFTYSFHSFIKVKFSFLPFYHIQYILSLPYLPIGEL